MSDSTTSLAELELLLEAYGEAHTQVPGGTDWMSMGEGGRIFNENQLVATVEPVYPPGYSDYSEDPSDWAAGNLAVDRSNDVATYVAFLVKHSPRIVKLASELVYRMRSLEK